MDIRREICRIGRRLEEKGFITAACGNISFKIEKNRILITPSGVRKGSLEPKNLIIIDMKGHVISGRGRPSSETPMHLAVYKKRPDVRAAIHAHPVNVTALTTAGIKMEENVLPEIFLSFGRIGNARYATPCTIEDAIVVSELLDKTDAIVLDRHGSLTVGDSLESAYMRLELMEHAAEIIAKAHTLGQVRTLSKNQLKKLTAVRKKF